MDDDLFILMIRTTKLIVDRLRADRPSSPMTAMHGLAARYLVGRDDVTVGELARYLRMTKQSASEVVAVLEQGGLVRKAPHPSDGRARVLLLTEIGEEKLADGRRRWKELQAEWAALVGEDKLHVVHDALEAYLRTDLPADALGDERA